MDEPGPTPSPQTNPTSQPLQVGASAVPPTGLARGSGYVDQQRTEDSVMEGLPDAKAERVAAMRRDLAELQRQLIEAQQRIEKELRGRVEDAERFETLETECARLQAQLASVTEQVQAKTTALDEAKTRLETRDADHVPRTELVAMTTERDAVKTERDAVKAERDAVKGELVAMTTERDAAKGELEHARRELESTRAKAREVANQLVRCGQDLLDGDGGAHPGVSSEPRPATRASSERLQPPPMPHVRAAAQAEPIVAVIEEPSSARSRLLMGLLILIGVVLGSAVTVAFGMSSSSGPDGSEQRQSVVAPVPAAPAAAVQAATGTAATVEAPSVSPPSSQPSTPVIDPGAPAAPKDPTDVAITSPGNAPSTGAIVLPSSAAGHRVFVDGRVVEVTGSRAVVACGAREVRIGSTGTTRKLDVKCGGETDVPADSSGH